MAELVITNGIILTMNKSDQVIESGYVVINDSKIADIGPMSRFRKPDSSKVIDAKGKLVMPGFVNVHSHVADILLRGGLSQDRSLYDWLLNVLYPGMGVCTIDNIRVGTRLYLVEAIRSGITTVVDNEDFPSPKNHKVMLEVFRKSGMRTIFGRMFSDSPPPPNLAEFYKTIERKSPNVHHVHDYLIEETRQALSQTENLIKEFNSTDGLIQIWPSPFNPAWCTKEGLLGSLDLANNYNTGITIHLGETEIESKPFGMSSTEYLHSINFLNRRLLAAHCVWLDDKDISLIKKNDVKVAHQPSANMYLASGFAPIPKMLAQGITVGLGSDDANDNDSVNIFSEMRAASLVHKANLHDASCITSDQVIKMATIMGANALGMNSYIGSLEVGKNADVIILDLKAPHLRPIHHIPSVLAYQARGNEVEAVIVNGKILMENRKLTWMDESEEARLLDEAQSASVEVRERANLELPKTMLIEHKIEH
jgi:cytosine/adenosine deaminase-related metal-dependent hydrolase